MSSPIQTIRGALAHRRAPVWVIVVAMLLAGLSIRGGWLTDDYSFRAVLQSDNPKAPPVYDLFRFVRGDLTENAHGVTSGRLPWWTAPDFKVHFLRPLTGLSMALDYRWLGDSPLVAHAHSLFWYLALLILVALWLRRVVNPPAATLGLAVFAFTAAHVQAYAWWSARHILIGAVPATCALYIHVRGRQTNSRSALFWAPLALMVGLMGSESALAAVPIWMAFELFGRNVSSRSRLSGCLAPWMIALAYLILYKALGGGTAGGDGYNDPLADPLGFLRVAALRIPILLGDAALGIPAELGNVVVEWHLAVVGLLALALVGVALYLTHGPSKREGDDAAPPEPMVWLLVGGLGATLIGATGFPSGRVLVIPNVAFSAVIGVILARALDARFLGKALAVLLMMAHLVLGPLAVLRNIHKLHQRAHITLGLAQAIVGFAPPSGKVTLIAGSDPMVFFYPRGIVAKIAPRSLSCWSVLSAARSSHRLTRSGPSTLVLEAVDRPILSGGFDRLFRAPSLPFKEGDTFTQCGTTVRVIGLSNGLPNKLEVDLGASLDNPDNVLLFWGKGLERLDVPPIGATIELPWIPGPAGL